MSGTDGYRYPGPNEFEDTPADHLLFSGRDEEISAITQQIVSVRHLVLYGCSGLGKSSLLKAGVYPRLRESNFCPIRVRITDKIDVLQLLAQSCEEAEREADMDYTPGIGNTPWEFFKTAMFWRGETLLFPVLVFDQFEELFTTVRPAWKKEFANEIGPLATGNLPQSIRRRLEQGEKGLTDLPPPVKLIFGLREEFYGSLEELSSDFPALFQDRFRLLPMNRSRAELAIRLPALKQSQEGISFRTPVFTYSEDAMSAMLNFLAGRHGTIEPFQLQLLCQHIERVIVPTKIRAGSENNIEITQFDIGGERMMSELVRRFYTDSLAQLPVLEERRARELCDSGLISTDGHRLMLEKNEILRTYKVSEKTLQHLVDKRILREEPRLDSLFYEIGHDTIAHSILKTRRLRIPRKYRVPAAVIASLLLIFVVYGFVTNRRLLRERNEANTAQKSAEDARTKAERLASYLIGEDLMEAIKPMGRLEVLESVQKQIDNYLVSLSPNEAAGHSDLATQIAGLAALNRGDIEYMQEKIGQANLEYRQAQAFFEQLVRTNPHNPEWLHDLADAQAKIAAVRSDQYLLQQSTELYQHALKNVQQALNETPPGKNDKLRDKLLRDEADIYQNIGGNVYQQRRFSEALVDYKKSVELANPALHPTTQWSYILQDALIGEAFVFESQGEQKDAEEALQNALSLGRTVAHDNPYDPEAQRRLGVAENQIANFYIYRIDPDQVLSEYESLYSIMQQAIHWEPKNEKWQRDLAYTYLLLQGGYQSAGKSDRGEQLLKKAVPGFERLLQIDASNASLISDLADAHHDWGQYLASTDPNGAVSHYQESLKLIDQLSAIDPTNKVLTLTEANTLNDEAEALRNSNKTAEAVIACRKALDLVNSLNTVDASDAEYWELLSFLHQQMGDLKRNQGDVQAANREYQEALADIGTTIERAPGSARYLNDRFRLRFEHLSAAENDQDKNLILDQEALADIMKAVELDPKTSYFHYNLAFVRIRLGDDYMKREKTSTALTFYEDAETSYKNAIAVAGKQDAEQDRELLDTLLSNNIIPARKQIKDKTGTQRSYEELIRVRSEEARTHSQDITYVHSLAAAQISLGDFVSADNPTAALGYYTDAEQTYRNALRAANASSADYYRDDLQQLFSKHVAPLRAAGQGKDLAMQPYEEAVQEQKRQVASDPTNAEYRINLAKAYKEVGDDLLGQGHLTEAKEFYLNAEQSQREGLKLKPAADAWDNLGSLFYNSFAPLSEKQNDEASALKYFRQAAEAEEQAVTLDPKNGIYLSNMGYAYQAIGNTLVVLHDKSAEDEYKRSAEWFQKSLIAKRSNASAWYGLTLTYEAIAQIHEDAGDQTSARENYATALENLKTAGQLEPNDKKYSDERASIETKLRQLNPK